MKKNILIDYLMEHNMIDEKTLNNAISSAFQQQRPFVCYLAQQKLIAPLLLMQLIQQFTQVKSIDLTSIPLKKIPLNILPLPLMQEFLCIPLSQSNTHVDLAMVDPSDLTTLHQITFFIKKKLRVVIAPYDLVKNIIKQLMSLQNTHSLQTLEKNRSLTQEQQYDFFSDNDEPLICFVNDMIEMAIQKGASDIHFEHYEKKCRVRFRLDGLLHEIASPPYHIAQRLIARLKIMAKMDISEKRIPQDGRCKIKISDQKIIDIRVNSCPTLFGEKIVLRLLDSGNLSKSIDELGFNATQKKHFLEMIDQPQGLVLVTGPTGSGKTVTLYAALKYLNTISKNISTVEDPVEINLSGINQVHINPKAGLLFPNTLRAFLRQDPDIIMLGEIRDLETAEIAIKAAHTGHLVLSTLHTNSAIETITRLTNMGVASYNLSSSISLITAQRLARKLCAHCRLPVPYNRNNTEIIYKAKGCKHCHDGYQGRIAIHEVLPIRSDIHHLISNNQPSALMNLFEEQKTLTLQESAFEKVQEGLTSLEEIYRVIHFSEKI